MQTLLRTLDLEVVDTGDCIEIRRRAAIFLILGAAATIALGGAIALDRSGKGLLTPWLCAILVLLWALLGVATLVTLSRKPVVFDRLRQTLFFSGRMIPLPLVKNIEVAVVEFGRQRAMSITAQIEGRKQFIVSGQPEKHHARVESIANELRRLVSASAPVSAGAAAPASTLPNQFMGTLLIVLGALWSGAGYFFATNLVLVNAHSATGDSGRDPVLFWPLGFWIAALGVLELFGISVLKLRGTKRVIAAVLFMGSYFLICGR